jgi:hypothetical protein
VRDRRHPIYDRLGNVVAFVHGDQILDAEGSVLVRVRPLARGSLIVATVPRVFGFIDSNLGTVRETTGPTRDDVYGGDFIGGHGGSVIGNLRQAAARFPEAASDVQVSTAMLLALLFISKRVCPDLLAKEKAQAAARLFDPSKRVRSEFCKILNGSGKTDGSAPGTNRKSRTSVGVVRSRGSSARQRGGNRSRSTPAAIGNPQMRVATRNPPQGKTRRVVAARLRNR